MPKPTARRSSRPKRPPAPWTRTRLRTPDIGAPITATDSDNDTLTYSLENAGVSHFGIDSSTGQLLVGSPLDHETEHSYTVKVIATDPSESKDTIDVTITVNNLEEPGTVSLSWKQPQVDTELAAALTDPDGDVSGTAWQWARSDAQGGNYTDIDGESVGALHARTRRRGQIPAGHGVLYRRGGLRQDRANGVLQAGPGRAVGQQPTGFPRPGLGVLQWRL